MHIFESRVSIYIYTQKRLKSDIQKTRRGIFIGYIGMSKHLRVEVPYTYQISINSKLRVNESKRVANLLIRYLLPPAKKPLWPQIEEPKLRDWLYKSTSEKTIEDCDNLSKSPYDKDVAIKKNASGDELA